MNDKAEGFSHGKQPTLPQRLRRLAQLIVAGVKKQGAEPCGAVTQPMLEAANRIEQLEEENDALRAVRG